MRWCRNAVKGRTESRREQGRPSQAAWCSQGRTAADLRCGARGSWLESVRAQEAAV